MRTTLKTLSALCAGSLLFACADLGKPVLAPAAAVEAAPSADEAYQQGRQQHLAGDLTAAAASYRSALQTAPNHVNARNGLAALAAEQGDLPGAIAIWMDLTAGATRGPDQAYLFSNLGYAYLLGGDYQKALAALGRACVLDPINYRAWRYLGDALAASGQGERAQLMYKQADALEAHDFKADYAVAQRGGVAAIDSAVVAAAPGVPDAPAWPETELHQGASGIFELRRAVSDAAVPPASPVAAASLPSLPAAAAAAPLAVSPPAALPAQAVALLEIRNGNGVTGMARSLARKMDGGSLRVVRLSNQKGFGVQRTRVEYEPAFRQAAQQLAERVGSSSVVEVENCKSSDMRLVIGRDLVHRKLVLRRAAPPALVAERVPPKTS